MKHLFVVLLCVSLTGYGQLSMDSAKIVIAQYKHKLDVQLGIGVGRSSKCDENIPSLNGTASQYSIISTNIKSLRIKFRAVTQPLLLSLWR